MKHIALKATLVSATCLGAIGLVGTALPASAAQGPVISHAPRIAAKAPNGGASISNYGWSSSNWSGYAITGSGFNSITGDWTVPTVQRSTKSTYSSSWIGIDGFNNNNLIQTGTEQDYYNGSAHYDAWWEILPASETVISSLTVRPGDHIHADIENKGSGQWTITLQNVTTGKSFTTTQTYNGPQTSAEWIQEAPTVGGRVATLANYGKVTFDPGTVNGQNPHLTSSDGGTMVQNNTQVSTPSVPDADTDGFNAAYGSTAPAAPTS